MSHSKEENKCEDTIPELFQVADLLDNDFKQLKDARKAKVGHGQRLEQDIWAKREYQREIMKGSQKEIQKVKSVITD